MRVDAESVWLEGRSRYERIPRGSRYMEVVVSAGGGNRRRALVVDPDRIASTVDLVNSLPVLQRDACAPELEEPSRSNPRVEVLFRSSRAGWPLARIATELVQQESCPALHFWLRGRPERTLAESRLVIGALHGTMARLDRAVFR